MEGFTRDGVTVVCTGDRDCKEEGRVGALEENWKQDEVSVSSLNLGIERMAATGQPIGAHLQLLYFGGHKWAAQ